MANEEKSSLLATYEIKNKILKHKKVQNKCCLAKIQKIQKKEKKILKNLINYCLC
jgi:hypothetical protein